MHAQNRRLISEINVVPYIDVMLVLLVRLNPDVPMFARGDEGATHGRVMHGFALLKRAGAKQVVLVTDLPDEQ